MSTKKNQTVLVTGSTRGIGRATAIQFAKNDYPIVLTGIQSQETLSKLQQLIETQYDVPCMSFLGDLGNYETVKQLFSQIENFCGGIDILINNVGISHIGLLSHMEIEMWDTLLKTNLSSYFYCCKLAIPHMVSQKSGKIINISSVWGEVGASCEAAYAATKGAINALTKSLGKELAPSNIQVNAIACGVIDTEMNKFLDDDERQFLLEEIPAGKFADPDEVGDFVLQLAQSGSYLTGQVIGFDGGWI